MSRKKARAATVDNPVEYGFKDVKPLNFVQTQYLEAIKANEVIFGIGSAGTGKTFIAASYAAGELFHRRIEKIFLTRPSVQSGRGLGHLPGTLEEKYSPYLMPFEDIFQRSLGKGFYEYAVKNKNIEARPLEFMRGSSFNNCIVLADEMQNCTKDEMKMILSRIGRNCKMIFSGDSSQSDIKEVNGLNDAINKLSGIPGIEIVNFLDEDIVRSKMCKQIIMAYNYK